jgi:hypothetical protein
LNATNRPQTLRGAAKVPLKKPKVAVPAAPQPLDASKASSGKAAAREELLGIGNRE